ncbi:TPR-like protein [Violaceomyces palustris]|uniref:TPR-like protein n=1 Tax=Violaceomyces palustris TaxID=1673888 RepID=A0ACD0NNN1_9BASI|nr:TPR-like protein [Violaceomyces palustris]
MPPQPQPLPPQPPPAPSRQRQNLQSQQQRLLQLQHHTRIAANAPPPLTSRLSLDSANLSANSSSSISDSSFGIIPIPTRQPVFTQYRHQQRQLQQQQQQQQPAPIGTSSDPTASSSRHDGPPPPISTIPSSSSSSSSSTTSRDPNNNSFLLSSPRPKKLTRLAPHQEALLTPLPPSAASCGAPHTPRTPVHDQINPDGSLSVIRNEQDANTSGLLDLSPALSRLGATKHRSKARLLSTPTGPKPNPASVTAAAFLPQSSLGVMPIGDRAGPSQIIPSSNSEAKRSPSNRNHTRNIRNHDLEAAESSIIEYPVPQPPLFQSLPLAENEDHDVEIDAPDLNDLDVEEETGLVPRLRRWMHDARLAHLYGTAIFWGDKLLALETGPQANNDAYWLAQCYFATHQYAKAEHLLTTPLRTGSSSAGHSPGGTQTKKEKCTKGDDVLIARSSDGGDALTAALAATRSKSQLPSAILAKASQPSIQAGVKLRSHTMSRTSSGVSIGKRKERHFTVSGNGSVPSSPEDQGRVSGGPSNGHREAEYDSLHAREAGDIEWVDDENECADETMEAELGQGAWWKTKKSRSTARLQRGAGYKDEKLSRLENEVLLEEDLRQVQEKDVPSPDGPILAHYSMPCRYLTAQCQVRLGKYYEALELIGEDPTQWQPQSSSAVATLTAKEMEKMPTSDGGIKLVSSICYLRGQIYMRLEDIGKAKESFISALSLDVKNYEAFSALIDGNLLGIEEQWSLIQGLEFTAQAGESKGAKEDFEFIRLIYTTKLSKQGRRHAVATANARRKMIKDHEALTNHPDLLLALAEEFYSRLRYSDAFVITSRIMEMDPNHKGALAIHIGCMYHLKDLRSTLFMLAHRLTEVDPESPQAWYAVGAWYAGAQRWNEARRYFSKSSLLDPRFASSWVAFGHSFSFEGETDQAITAYSTASRKFKQSNLPNLFIGMEHLNQGNLNLAEVFLNKSFQLCEDDPLCLNEMGVVAYYKDEIKDSIDLLRKALQASEEVQEPASAWKMTHLNLGFAYHRIGSDDLAKECFLKVIELDPNCFSAYLGLGMTCHRLGDLSNAIGWYHDALRINPRDNHATELLDFILQERSYESNSLIGLGGDIEDENSHLFQIDQRIQEVEEGDEEDGYSFSRSLLSRRLDTTEGDDDHGGDAYEADSGMDTALSGASTGLRLGRGGREGLLDMILEDGLEANGKGEGEVDHDQDEEVEEDDDEDMMEETRVVGSKLVLKGSPSQDHFSLNARDRFGRIMKTRPRDDDGNQGDAGIDETQDDEGVGQVEVGGTSSYRASISSECRGEEDSLAVGEEGEEEEISMSISMAKDDDGDEGNGDDDDGSPGSSKTSPTSKTRMVEGREGGGKGKGKGEVTTAENPTETRQALPGDSSLSNDKSAEGQEDDPSGSLVREGYGEGDREEEEEEEEVSAEETRQASVSDLVVDSDPDRSDDAEESVMDMSFT